MASGKIGVGLKGADKLLTQLKRLEDELQKKVLRAALQAGGELMLSAAQQNCPVKTGKLKESLRLAVRKKKGGYAATVSTGQGFFKGATFYGAFVEFGHLTGPRNGRARDRTRVPARPFMRPAFDSTKEAAVARVKAALQAGIDAALKR